jgi:hypothetical protein
MKNDISAETAAMSLIDFLDYVGIKSKDYEYTTKLIKGVITMVKFNKNYKNKK